MRYQPRFENGVYRDCKWCNGRGCLSCEAEADKEYARQFPDGPKPILTMERNEGESTEDLLKRALTKLFPNDSAPTGDNQP